jgi:hypothetical protein
VVVVEECGQAFGKRASGVWEMNTVYDFVKADNWTNS